MRPALECRIAENQALQSAFTSAGYKFANRTTVGEQEVVLYILNPEDSTSIGGDRN